MADTSPTRSFELKYRGPTWAEAPARTALAHLCHPDPSYPEAIVTTIYFDTPSLQFLEEKQNSDYLKKKVRLRWYTPVEGGCRSPVFLEVKEKCGAARTKLRAEVPYDARFLDESEMRLIDEATSDLPSRVRALGAAAPQRLVPAVRLSYRRSRYVERISGTRIALDSDIALLGVNEDLLDPPSSLLSGPQVIPALILEVKGSDDELPPVLRPLVGLGLRRGSFSKYLSCLEENGVYV